VNQKTLTLGELAEIAGGKLVGDADVVITGVAGIRDARRGDITFLANPKYEEFLQSTRASAVIGPPGLRCKTATIETDDPYLGFLKVLSVFAEAFKIQYPRGIHPSAIIDPEAEIGDNVSIGPHCEVCRGAKVGNNSTVLLGTYVGRDVEIGGDCLIYPNVTIREGSVIGNRVVLHPGAVIASDGFGFARTEAGNNKIPQIGHVVIEDDVEIGANTTIDRATTGVTRICQGVKIDNLVQVAHNVVVGKNSMLAAQVGISGSAEIGEGVFMSGQSGSVGHIRIGDRVAVGAQAGVSKDVPEDTMVWGYPAMEHSLAKRLVGYTRRLPDMNKRIRDLEKRIAALEKELEKDLDDD
jgi:UDP-3-O-[3-hydroxymyristoyl] glucosamine N-acyltransferase